MRAVVVVQARLASERFPCKILAPLGKNTMLEQIVRRCNAARPSGHGKPGINEVVVACPPPDEQAIFEATGIVPIAGPEKDVLSRMLIAAMRTRAGRIVRVTADCPFVCPRMIEAMIDHQLWCKKPAVFNWIGRTFPDGLDLEVYDVAWLRNQVIKEDDREYFAQWIAEHGKSSDVERIINPDGANMRKYRLTVDWPEDLEMAQLVYNAMGGEIWDAQTIIQYLRQHPKLTRINAHRIDGTFGARRP